MIDAENAVHAAAANIPAEVRARFDSVKKLSDKDRATIIQIARNALARFQPKPEPVAKTVVEPKPKATSKDKP